MSNVGDIQKLREQTGAGMMAAKKALEEASGDFDKAVDLLRQRGVKVAASKGSRATGQGLVEAYIHMGGKLGVLVELACETDFVARTDKFKELAHDLAMHVAASNPLYLEPSEIPMEVIAHEKQIYTEQLAAEGKKGEMVEKIVEGKLVKYYQEVCLLQQQFFKDDKQTVTDVITAAIVAIGENIKVRRFARFALGS
ncbi:MAG TPA: elongation factor Ts [Candidatus Veblenbacteria bacterium]|uniref:Elongation factor Ts n=5 Tax=Candidatus Vebleniibacteriota TaxID=1817921 RepID=A0A1G2Q3N0_9BACT|nr:MAG: Elongation factor Ts [Parcubacteria group bacterium GW2011_GWE2_43_12]KKT12173.1 MAG: Elongation factor Ts [Parcubacteria group bacterium GW2011_GWA1_43_27]KKT22500.1 MAG: Elongation factor Ts [Parcubacteria group bacterium GW2011_GWE1_43_8]OHA55016.1 MAG: elongation factor Ts [Candidatus Veblenbacteria bacterium RIFOXYB1_FULL_43_13]OHA55164.1 MAG: elongation factor Ts [Candidatus Veblenbacteria bacterium RIFOXYC1_FULL_42_9]OHA55878.1 MAG: elongation factor Ts [Candidatus Veblenbacteri